MLSALKQCQRNPRNFLRSFHSPSPISYPRSNRRRPEQLRQEDAKQWNFREHISPEAERQATAMDLIDGMSSLAHLDLAQERQKVMYMRLVEHDLPKLVAYRRAYEPQSTTSSVSVRALSFGGEQHPATAKRTVVASVARLPLSGHAAVHKFKLLAGPRWTPQPPGDSGFDDGDIAAGEHGYVKISCENFPHPNQNLKWASDALDRLLQQANILESNMDEIPLDTRHVREKIKKSKRVATRPTLKDFPEEWLPDSRLGQ